MSPVIFPDVEMWACGALKSALAARPESYAASVFVATSVPSPTRTRMVVVRRDGGPQLDVVREAARIGVRVWAGTEQETNDLARLVRALLVASANGRPVCRVRSTSGPSALSEPDGKPLRYLTFELTVRGADLI